MGLDKYAQLRTEIHTFYTVDGRCGYRRIHVRLKEPSFVGSEKVVCRLMEEVGLQVGCVRPKKYSFYAGEISPKTPIIVNRDFDAGASNIKSLTDIT